MWKGICHFTAIFFFLYLKNRDDSIQAHVAQLVRALVL